MTELSRIADQDDFMLIVPDITRSRNVAHWREPHKSLDELDREMVLWRRVVIGLAGCLIITGIALYAWAST